MKCFLTIQSYSSSSLWFGLLGATFARSLNVQQGLCAALPVCFSSLRASLRMKTDASFQQIR
jgi:hypothetical protein